MESAVADSCPIPPTMIEPRVTVTTSQDKNSGTYTYTYVLSNGPGAKNEFQNFVLLLNAVPESPTAPDRWKVSLSSSGTGKTKVDWRAFPMDGVPPGREKSGFTVKSKLAPGPVQYFALGVIGDRVGTPTEEDDEPTPDCAGFYDQLPKLDSMISGVVLGPAGPDTIEAEIELKDSNGVSAAAPISPYASQGSLYVLLKSKKELSVTDIDLSSLRLGVGKAPLTESKRLGASGNLLLQFDVRRAAVECGRDREITLTGRTKSGKSLLGSAPIQVKNCDQRPKTPKGNHVKLKDVIEMKRRYRQNKAGSL
jgi:hypothetical protein